MQLIRRLLEQRRNRSAKVRQFVKEAHVQKGCPAVGAKEKRSFHARLPAARCCGVSIKAHDSIGQSNAGASLSGIYRRRAARRGDVTRRAPPFDEWKRGKVCTVTTSGATLRLPPL